MNSVVINGMSFSTLEDGAELSDVFGNDHYTFSNVSQNGTVIDMGANVGAFSVRAAKERKCMCYAYEASHNIFPLLLSNLAVNHVQDRVKAFNMAVADTKGTRPFYYSPQHPGGSSLWDTDKGQAKEEVVDCVTIADVFNDNHIEVCDFLKMDIECAEELVIKAEFLPYLQRCRFIAFEFHCTNLVRICELMATAGFDVGDYKAMTVNGGTYSIKNKVL